MFLIDSIGLYPQSAVTLYIYRVGKTYPARNYVYRYKSIKNSDCTRTPHGPVRPTGRAPARSPTVPDRSDRLVRPVRPVDANFGCKQGPVLTLRPTGAFQKYKKQHMIHSQKMIISMQLKIID